MEINRENIPHTENIEISQSNADDILKFASESGMIDLQCTLEQMQMNRRQNLLQMHDAKVWQGCDGKWYTYLNNNNGTRKKLKKNSRLELDDCIVEYYIIKSENPTINELFDMWIDEKYAYKEIAASTRTRYKTDYNRFFFDTPFERMRIRDINEDILYSFIKKTIADNELTAKAYSGLRLILKGILKYAKRRHLTDISAESFFQDIDIGKNSFKRKIKNKEAQVFSDNETRLITHYIEDNPTIKNLAILLSFQTGVRIGELSTLKLSDINFETRTIHVQRTETLYQDDEGERHCEIKDYPKSDAGDRYVIILDSTVQTLKRIKLFARKGEYLFEENGKRIRSSAIRDALYKVCDAVGITRRSNHKIRRTYGTMLLDGYTDESLVTEQMGHNDINTTRRFYYFCNRDSEEKRRQIEKAINF